MARPARNDADYFPFLCKDGATLVILRQRFEKTIGIGMFTELMRILTTTPYHHIVATKPKKFALLAGRIGVDEDMLSEFLDILVLTDKIHKDLWEKASVIVSEDHLQSISDAYRSRANPIITIEELVSQYIGGKPPEKKSTDDDILSAFNDHVGPGTGSGIIERLRAEWNSHDNLTPCPRMVGTLRLEPEMMASARSYSEEVMIGAIRNFSALKERAIDAGERVPGTFENFVAKSLDNWTDDAKPKDRLPMTAAEIAASID